MHVWNVQHAARWKNRMQKITILAPSHHCWAVSSQLRHVSTIRKNLLNIDTSSTRSYNMVNFGLLMAEICWRVWGTPANFNGFASWQHSAGHSSSGRQPNFAVLYSAGRPLRWALAHILVFHCSLVTRNVEHQDTLLTNEYWYILESQRKVWINECVEHSKVTITKSLQET